MQLRILQAQCQKSLLSMIKCGKEEGDSGMMSTVDICQLAARREENDWVHSEGVYEIVPMLECQGAGMKPVDLIWVDTDKSVDPAYKKIRSRLCAREYKTEEAR